MSAAGTAARPALRALFYGEFDADVGPKILYQAPADFPLAALFDSVSPYVIAKEELCGKVISVKAGRYRVVGIPAIITNARYARNTLHFNTAFVFDAAADTKAFEPVVRKLSRSLERLEAELRRCEED